jgi:alginate O-acetyltransferase complex protein AlgJ
MGKLEKPNRRLPGVLLLVFLLAGFLLALFNPALLRAPENRDIVGGGWTVGYMDSFERMLPFRDTAVQAIGAIRYLLFREGEEGVLVGEGGWLFTTEEFACHPDGLRAMADKLGYVREVRDLLDRRGIDLVVLLLPAKARIYHDRLGRYRFPFCADSRYEAFRLGILGLKVGAPDMLKALREARRQGEVFLRTDTHWTPFGAGVAAAEIAQVARPKLDHKGSARLRYQTHRLGVSELEGDLLRFLPLGQLPPSLAVRPDWVDELETVALDDSGLGLFDQPVIPVALVGTSYSSGKSWNFAGALKEALETDVLNLGAEGQGSFLPMQAYLNSETFEKIPPDLVIWEIPERYLETPNFRAP